MPRILGVLKVVTPNHKAKLHKQAPELNHVNLNVIQKMHKFDKGEMIFFK